MDDPVYPDMPSKFENHRTCIECEKSQGLDYDGWCDFMTMDEYRTKNDPLYAHLKTLKDDCHE